jgi:two-component system, OmpR family, phosphate regulon sensor histidine kinase PhoR
MQTRGEILAILQGLPLAALVVDADARITLANDAALSLFGQTLLGRHHGISFRQPDFLRAVDAALTGRGGSRVRLAQSAVAQDVVYQVTVSALPDGALCVFEDYSAQEQMGQMRRDFVANVSHELRTPLTALLGFIETLQGPARNDPAARERFLGIMASEAERMSRLVRDLLHLSRVEAEELRRPTDAVDLASLLRSVASNLRAVAEAGRVQLLLEGADTPTLLRADADQMTQVMSNLIENAVKYGSPSGSTVRVSLSKEMGPRGEQLCLRVSDQGEGIEPQHIPRLTERFYRVDGHRSREKGGTGLGLAIVKHIVNRHRGRLVIESEKGKGSRFSVFLPLS